MSVRHALQSEMLEALDRKSSSICSPSSLSPSYLHSTSTSSSSSSSSKGKLNDDDDDDDDDEEEEEEDKEFEKEKEREGEKVDVLLFPVTSYVAKTEGAVRREAEEGGQLAAFLGDALTVRFLYIKSIRKCPRVAR